MNNMECKKIIKKIIIHIWNTKEWWLYKHGFLYKLHEEHIFDIDKYNDLKEFLVKLNSNKECLEYVFYTSDDRWMCGNYIYHIYHFSQYILWLLIDELQSSIITKRSNIDYYDLQDYVWDLLDLFKEQFCKIKPS